MYVFSKEWFEKYQKLLLCFANTLIGRRVFGLNSSNVGRNKIIRILPNSITWKGKGKKLVTEFRTHDKFGKRLYYAFKPIWHLLHLWDMVWCPNFNLGFDSLTAYPVAGANSPVDGRAWRIGTNEDFSTIRGGAGTNSDATEASSYLAILRATVVSNAYDLLSRSIFCFDTSSLGASAAISAATFSWWQTSSDNGLVGGSTPDYDIVASTPSATNSLSNSDYGQLGTTVFGSKAYSAFSNGQYNDITLDSNGILNISKTGVSKFGSRLSWDTDNNFTGTWDSTRNIYSEGYFADQTGTANDPKLVVTYIPARPSFLLNFV